MSAATNTEPDTYISTRADVDAIRAHLDERYMFPSADGLERLVALGVEARAFSAGELRDFYKRVAHYLHPSFFREK